MQRQIDAAKHNPAGLAVRFGSVSSRSRFGIREHALTGDIDAALVQRLGRRYAEQRIRLEEDHGPQACGRGFFQLEKAHYAWLIRNTLRALGLYRRGRKNAAQVELRRNPIVLARLPIAFDGFTILHISDLHVDTSQDAMRSLNRLVEDLDYDLCVLTGDYRGRTRESIGTAVAGLAALKANLRDPVYGVLGNHDSIRMVSKLEALGIRMLLNECEALSRGDDRIYLAGIDDAHHFRAENLEKAFAEIPEDGFSILLSHTPEIYRQAAAADFKLLLAGHTHGGQICLPGSIPITLCSVLPRYMGSGPWAYRGMTGYTSTGVGTGMVPVRFHCPPTITLHTLRCPPATT